MKRRAGSAAWDSINAYARLCQRNRSKLELVDIGLKSSRIRADASFQEVSLRPRTSNKTRHSRSEQSMRAAISKDGNVPCLSRRREIDLRATIRTLSS